MRSWVSALSLAALLPLVAADCDNFDFTGQYGGDGFSTTYNKTFQVSGWTNCTDDLAAQNNGNNTCLVHNPGVNIGLEVNPEVRYIQVDSKTQKEILALVQEKMNAAPAATTNFNSTIVMNFTSVTKSISIGDVGYAGFTPYINCFDGVLSDCDDDDNLEGKAIRACGLKWLGREQAAKEQGRQLYDGIEGWVTYDDNSGAGIPDSLPSYDSISGHATNYQGDDENSAVRSVVGSAALVVALLSSVYEIM
ncbi:hypothetical protein F4805DRAFT_216967 [Annulohypoxylon moriforme]|nr:hypothetical protein F4805DRAFT_216967 [Annulohypoxylon moriforme]